MPLPICKPTSRLSLSFAYAIILLACGLAGCSSSRSNEDMLARKATETPRSDVYPDFSKPLVSAMPQLSDEAAAKQSAELDALAARRKSGAISDAEYWRRAKQMRALAEATPKL